MLFLWWWRFPTRQTRRGEEIHRCYGVSNGMLRILWSWKHPETKINTFCELLEIRNITFIIIEIGGWGAWTPVANARAHCIGKRVLFLHLHAHNVNKHCSNLQANAARLYIAIVQKCLLRLMRIVFNVGRGKQCFLHFPTTTSAQLIVCQR